MFDFSMRMDSGQARKVLAQVQKQVTFASAVALTQVAKNIKAAERVGILDTFRNPRSFTVNSVGIIPATKATLTATIYIKDHTASYLNPYEHGGSHFLPNHPELGRVILEPVNIKLDRSGQMSHLKTLLARPDVFVGTVHSILGIWQRLVQKRGTQRTGGYGTKGKLLELPTGRRISLRLLAKVIPNKPVPAHLNFDVRGMAMFLDQFPGAFETAFANAIATAR